MLLARRAFAVSFGDVGNYEGAAAAAAAAAIVSAGVAAVLTAVPLPPNTFMKLNDLALYRHQHTHQPTSYPHHTPASHHTSHCGSDRLPARCALHRVLRPCRLSLWIVRAAITRHLIAPLKSNTLAFFSRNKHSFDHVTAAHPLRSSYAYSINRSVLVFPTLASGDALGF